jgi:hypothetical protein
MWQFAVMWSLLPAGLTHWIVNLTLAFGLAGILAGWIGRWIPFFGDYARFLRPLGIVLLLGGVYLKGGESNNDMWLKKIEELEAKIAVSEQQSKDANKKLDGAIKEKNAAIKEKDKAIKNRITVVKDQIDRECTVDSVAVQILNDSAKEPKVKK